MVDRSVARSGAALLGALGVLAWAGVASAHCPTHGESCPQGSSPWLLGGEGSLLDRSFAVYDTGIGAPVLDGQFAEVFEGSGLGMSMRVGGGVDALAFLLALHIHSLESAIYTPLSLLAVGGEVRWYVPFDDRLEGLRVWLTAGSGWAWLVGCSDDPECHEAGDSAITDHGGWMIGGGAGLAYYFADGFFGFYAEARTERYWLESERLQRHIAGDLRFFTFGMINEFSWRSEP